MQIYFMYIVNPHKENSIIGDNVDKGQRLGMGSDKTIF